MNTPRVAVRSIVVPAGLALMGILLLWAVLLLASPDGRRALSSAQAQETETPTDGPTGSATDAETADPNAAIGARVTSYEVFLARDPFEPVIPELAADGTGDGTPTAPGTPTGLPTESPTSSPTTSPTATPTGTPTTSPTTSPTSSPTSSPSPTANPSDDPGCVSDGAVTCDGLSVSLVDVFTADGAAGAAVRVDGTLYEVTSGETFATSFRVLSIESPCVTLQYGDDRFSLCEGESILK